MPRPRATCDQDCERRLGRVGDRRDRVGGEDRQRERLREKRLLELGGGARPPDQPALGAVEQRDAAHAGGGASTIHPARRVLEDVVDGSAAASSKRRPERGARSTITSASELSASSTIASPAARARTTRVSTETPYSSAIARASATTSRAPAPRPASARGAAAPRAPQLPSARSRWRPGRPRAWHAIAIAWSQLLASLTGTRMWRKASSGRTAMNSP